MKYDVIVIGAGLGGLTAGAKLAREGMKVLVLEQHSAPGGSAAQSSLIGARIQQASGSAVKPGVAALPAPTRRWAELAAALRKGPRAAAALLDPTLESLLRPDKANTDEA